MTTTELIIFGLTVALAALAGGLIVYFKYQKTLTSLRESRAELSAQLDAERRHSSEKLATLESARSQLSETFSALASQALKHNSSEFLQLARENLKQFHVQAKGELAQREKAVGDLVKPIREALEKTDQQMRRMENDRKEAYGSLTHHLETMSEANKLLQTETRNLVQALRRPEVRGQWGEMTLRRLVELAGMVEHCDFYEQKHVATDDGAMRPDMIVRMPDQREIIVDAKTPLDAYLTAVEATDEATRNEHLKRHARKVRERVRELAGKAYWQQFTNAPDFVVLFIPGDQFLSAALDIDSSLLEDALANRVILSTPTSFVALLRAVGYGWRQEALAENAEHIRKVGEDLYSRLQVFSDHLLALGKSLDKGVRSFNSAVGSFDSRVLPSARKFTEMGISAKKEVPELDQIDHTTRTIQQQASPPASDETH